MPGFLRDLSPTGNSSNGQVSQPSTQGISKANFPIARVLLHDSPSPVARPAVQSGGCSPAAVLCFLPSIPCPLSTPSHGCSQRRVFSSETLNQHSGLNSGLRKWALVWIHEAGWFTTWRARVFSRILLRTEPECGTVC